jgi:bacillithiol biosynthesis deacetylase BshB1
MSRSVTERPSIDVDVLAVAAHRDDVELTCGGTLIRSADQGYVTGVVDLTAGEMGSRGSADTRAAEAAAAAEVMGLATRLNAGLPDGGIFNSHANRERLVDLLRSLRPRVVILPFFRGRHPDHRMASELIRDACYLAGLSRWPEGTDDGRDVAHRPEKLIYTLSYREDPIKPTFVVDISDQFERKMAAIRCYASQFDGVTSAGELFPTGQRLYDLIATQNRHYGSLIRAAYGEPFFTDETVRIEDVARMAVRSM